MVAGCGTNIPLLLRHPPGLWCSRHVRLTERIGLPRRSDAVVLCPLQANARRRAFASCHAKLRQSVWNLGFLPLHDSRGYCHQRNARTLAAAEEGALGGRNANLPRCILLDIEGTTSPISFVTDVLFPYARDNVKQHLSATYDSKETQNDIRLLRAQVQDDLEQGISGYIPIPPESADKDDVIDSVVHNVHAMIRADRKVSALKELQGHIWKTGFQNEELQGVMFDDVPEAFRKWHDAGIKIYIYSSGSREAQRLIFGNTVHGDLRKYLCGFFDTMIGKKTEVHSYYQISQFVGVDHPAEILFITDVYQEAIAAKAAGLDVLISIRPGNGALPENHGFKTITSFHETLTITSFHAI